MDKGKKLKGRESDGIDTIKTGQANSEQTMRLLLRSFALANRDIECVVYVPHVAKSHPHLAPERQKHI